MQINNNKSLVPVQQFPVFSAICSAVLDQTIDYSSQNTASSIDQVTAKVRRIIRVKQRLNTKRAMGAALPYEPLPTTRHPVQLSVAHGPSDVPLLDFKLAELLDFQCCRYGLQECLVIPWTGARWTYDFLRQESITLARALAAHGIRPGDRVAIMAGNCEQYVAVLFACMRIGAVLVILNNTYTASEARYALDFTGKGRPLF